MKPETASPTKMDAAVLAQLESEARRLGFDAVGVTTPDALAAASYAPPAKLDRFIALGHHGDMHWMAEHIERRRDPATLWSGARSIIMLGTSYAPDEDPLEILNAPDRAALSVYARGKDYHDILKGRLKQLARWIAGATQADVKVFVDTAPLMEKPLAATAGLGWQGKHTNLVSRAHGSWLFLGAIMTAAELPASTHHADHCGSCTRCLDICPTDAFPAPYELDARRCIAYLTIEHKGHIPRALRKPIGNRVFGCDDCLAVCPWNKYATVSREHRFAAREETDNPSLAQLLSLDDATFRSRFAGTPIKRTGRDRFIRNVLIAVANSGNDCYLPDVMRLLDDPSPLVRAMAIWALSRLATPGVVRCERNSRICDEPDGDVRSEWLETVEDTTTPESHMNAERSGGHT